MKNTTFSDLVLPESLIRAILIKDEPLFKHLLKPPESAGAYFGEFLKRQNLTPNAASKQLKVSQSTVQRLVGGSQLTENMAARIKLVFGIDPEFLMKIEAKHRAYAAKQLANSEDLKAAFA